MDSVAAGKQRTRRMHRGSQEPRKRGSLDVQMGGLLRVTILTQGGLLKVGCGRRGFVSLWRKNQGRENGDAQTVTNPILFHFVCRK